MTTPSPDTVKSFWDYMQQEYSSKIVAKDESAVMKVAATLLDTLNIQDKEQFMQNFVTTLHRTIYIPFDLGESHPQWSLWGQIRVCVHEHQHIEQGDRDGWATFSTRYVTSSSFRASYEAEAYGCDMEMEQWRLGSRFDPHKYAIDRPRSLKSYGCSSEDIEQARQILSIRAGFVAQNLVETRASQRAIQWLNQHAPNLRIAA